MARPWQDFSLKWLEQAIDASGFCRRFKITPSTAASAILKGFYFHTEDGHEHKLKGWTLKLEKLVTKAWTSRWVVTVAAEQEDLECPITIVINHPS